MANLKRIENVLQAIDSTKRMILDLEECLFILDKGFGYDIWNDPKQELNNKYKTEIQEDLDKEMKILKELQIEMKELNIYKIQ
tara:strand:- start:1290 stop:1538 length:249 start_codon:yes stop_codon:yes gene_type:complete